VIDAVVNVFLQGEYDYVSNTIVPTFPDGLDVEVFGVQALDRTWREALLPSEREHVTPYIWNHPADFRLRNFFNDFDLSHLRWTVDEPIDLVNLQRIFDSVPNAANLHMRAIMEGVASMSQVAERESLPQRNEGYMASLLQDSEYRRNGS
jgi:spore coat polysaccharide biosynthesis protein SpsF